MSKNYILNDLSINNKVFINSLPGLNLWIKRNCFFIDDSIYKLYINDLEFLLLLVIQINTIIKNKDFNGEFCLNRYIVDLYLNHSKKCNESEDYIQDMYLYDIKNRVYDLIPEFYHIIEKSIYKFNKIEYQDFVNSIKLYAEKYKIDNIYYCLDE